MDTATLVIVFFAACGAGILHLVGGASRRTRDRSRVAWLHLPRSRRLRRAPRFF